MVVTVQGVIVDGSTPIVAAPSRSPLTIPQGVDVTVVVPVVGSNGVPIPLTGYTAPTLNIRPAPGTLPKTSITGTLVGAVMSFVIPNATTSGFAVGTMHWDVFVTNAASLKDEVVPDSILTVAASDA